MLAKSVGFAIVLFWAVATSWLGWRAVLPAWTAEYPTMVGAGRGGRRECRGGRVGVLDAGGGRGGAWGWGGVGGGGLGGGGLGFGRCGRGGLSDLRRLCFAGLGIGDGQDHGQYDQS